MAIDPAVSARAGWPKRGGAAIEALKSGRQVGLPPHRATLLNLQLTARCISLTCLPSLSSISSHHLGRSETPRLLPAAAASSISSYIPPLPHQTTSHDTGFSHDPLTPKRADLVPIGFALAAYRRLAPHDKGDSESSAATSNHPSWSNASPTRSNNRRRTPATEVPIVR